MRKWVPLFLLAGLAACHKAEAPRSMADMAPAPAADASSVDGTSAKTPLTSPPPDAAQPSVPLLAYAFTYSLGLPADRIEPTLERDQRACAAAGPATCQLVGSSLSRDGDQFAGGHLDLRAVPSWVAAYRAGVGGEVKAAGGRVEQAGVQSEDLSRSIVDTQAAIRAKTTLRDRIEKLLAERPGKLSDVMDAEKELASVQGDLDATQSELAVMRERVAMSTLAIDYRAQGLTGPGGLFGPLKQAAGGFAGNMVLVLAALVSLASFVLPLSLAAAPLVGLAWWLRRRAAGRPSVPAPTAP